MRDSPPPSVPTPSASSSPTAARASSRRSKPLPLPHASLQNFPASLRSASSPPEARPNSPPSPAPPTSTVSSFTAIASSAKPRPCALSPPASASSPPFPGPDPDDFADRLAATTDSSGAKIFDALLVDSPTAQSLGGTGHSFPWSEAAGSFADAIAAGVYVIAAGGLNSQNVASVIHILDPTGVDVASGVESSPGRKDPARLKAFLLAAGIEAAGIEDTV